MACNKNYHFKMNLSNIPLKNNHFDWRHSVGCIIPFSSDVLNGELKIIEYLPQGNRSNSYIITSYKDKLLKKISTNQLKSGALHGILSDSLPSWSYNIGDIISDDTRNYQIIDRKIINNLRHYKILCLKCGFKSQNHILVTKMKARDEYWIQENKIQRGTQCPCCCPSSKIVVEGINDIATTNKWMIKYFKDKKCTTKYTARSQKRVDMVCPDCGLEKNYIISNLKKIGYLPCVCNDNISMPNKIAYHTIKNIPKFDNYIREYTPDWAGLYRYDNYFEYNEKHYLIEMDGSIGHGRHKYKSSQIDVDGLERDLIKNKLADKNGHILHRVDCSSNDYHIIFTNLVSTLESITNDSIILDEVYIMECATKNIIKDVCDYYMNVSKVHSYIASNFDISISTVSKYLEHGARYNWCNYQKLGVVKENNKNIAIEMYNTGSGFDEISNEINVGYQTVRNYIIEAAKDGLCDYNPQNAMDEGRKRGRRNMLEKWRKHIYVYDKELNYIGEYNSVMDLERASLNDFGIELKSRCVGRVCLGQRPYYKGYIFSYTLLEKVA